MIVGVLNAGGRSLRMGTNKALLRLGGKPIIERVLDSLRPVVDELLIIANDPEPYRYLGVPLQPDLVPRLGPLSGLHAGLSLTAADTALFVACDMPFLCPEVLRYLLEAVADHDAAVPKTDDGIHPLQAAYRRRCLPTIERLIEAGRVRMVDLCATVSTHYVDERVLRALDPSLMSLINVNTPIDLDRAERLIAASPAD